MRQVSRQDRGHREPTLAAEGLDPPVKRFTEKLGKKIEPKRERLGPGVPGYRAAKVEDSRSAQAEMSKQDGFPPLLQETSAEVNRSQHVRKTEPTERFDPVGRDRIGTSAGRVSMIVWPSRPAS